LSDIIFGYSAESAYNCLPPNHKCSIRKIYPLLAELAEKNCARDVDNTCYPPILGYVYRGIDIRFIVKPCGAAIIIEISCVTP